MKKKISKISGYLKIEKLKKDKRLIVFLVCTLIATALWFLNALNKDYSTTISYPVIYINPPKNQFIANTPPSKLEFKVSAHGFALLRHKLNLSFSPIVLNLTAITRNLESNSGIFNINTSSLIRRISDQVSSEITITGIQPENFKIQLDSLKTKFVPVKAGFSFNFKQQFSLREPASINPNEIKITGPGNILDTIQFVVTENKVFKDLDSDIEKTLNIIHGSNTKIIPDEVLVKIPVEKFTEKEIKIPIHVKNKPDNTKIKLFPSEIELTMLVGLSEFENVEATLFEVIVDYADIISKKENLEVAIQKKPAYIEVIRFSPEIVEYLIETN